MEQRQKEQSLIVDNSHRRMTFQIQNPQQIQRFHNVKLLRLKISILCLSTFYWGYCLAYLSTLSTQSLINIFGHQCQNSTLRGFLIGVLTLGAALGAFTSPFWMKCFTRRNMILLFNLCALVIDGVIQYKNLYCLFVCRAFQGFFVGILKIYCNFMALVPVYINQLCPKEIVSIFGVYTQLFAMMGVVISFALSVIMTKAGLSQEIIWRIMFGYDIIPILVIVICILLGVIPQSPNSLIMKGEKQQAKRVIGMFIKQQYIDEVYQQKLLQVQHQTNTQYQAKQQTVDQDINQSKHNSISKYQNNSLNKYQDKSNKNNNNNNKDYLQSNNEQNQLQYSKKAYFIGFLLPLMQQLTGINAITTQIGGIVDKHNPQFGYYTPLIINFFQFFATFGAITSLKLFGRKTILLTGNLGLGVLDIILGVLFIFIQKFPSAFWIVFALLIIYMIIFSTTIGPVVWMYVPQIIPAKIVPFATTLNWLGCSFTLIILPIINQSLGSSAVFFIFGAITLLIGIINLFAIVQTKGLTLKQIISAYK